MPSCEREERLEKLGVFQSRPFRPFPCAPVVLSIIGRMTALAQKARRLVSSQLRGSWSRCTTVRTTLLPVTGCGWPFSALHHSHRLPARSVLIRRLIRLQSFGYKFLHSGRIGIAVSFLELRQIADLLLQQHASDVRRTDWAAAGALPLQRSTATTTSSVAIT